MHVIRVATQNIWRFHGDWPNRRSVLADGLRSLQPDLIAFQEAMLSHDYDQARDLLGDDYHIAHQQRRGRDGGGMTVASRWPIAHIRELDFDVLVTEIEAPLGRLLFVNHCPRYELDNEVTRERETVAVARLVEEMHDGRHVILAGDLNARPESASLRFLRGLQSLDGMSVCYRDTWEAAHASVRRATGAVAAGQRQLRLGGEAGVHFVPLSARAPMGGTLRTA